MGFGSLYVNCSIVDLANMNVRRSIAHFILDSRQTKRCITGIQQLRRAFSKVGKFGSE